jgi:hypothetical protein
MSVSACKRRNYNCHHVIIIDVLTMLDNIDCFGDSVYVLSLGAGITMTMTLNTDPARATRGRDASESRIAQAARGRHGRHRPGDGQDEDEEMSVNQEFMQSSLRPDSDTALSASAPHDVTSESTGGDDDMRSATTKRHVYLPARSLLILTGDARYRWCHGIAQRTYDKVRVTVCDRGNSSLLWVMRLLCRSTATMS